MSEKFDDYTIKDEIVIDVPEHQVVVSFNADYQAEAFEDWLAHSGMEQFGAWLEENRSNYE